MSKRAKILYLLGGFLVVGSLVFNVFTATLIFKLERKIEEFYQKDFVDVKVVSEQLVRDIEKSYDIKMPLVELSIRLSEYSEMGIRPYDGKILQLFLSPKIIGLTSGQKRAYLAHEFGHYILKHALEYDIQKEKEADLFTLQFAGRDDLSEAISIMSYYDEEKKVRIEAIGQ